MKKLFQLSKLEWFLFLFLFCNYSYFFNEFPGWNEKTRMDLVYAIVDQGRMEIDSYWNQENHGYDTMDVALFNEHYYCDKSPILSLMGVPVYWVWEQVAGVFHSYTNPLTGRYPVIILTVSLPATILALLIFRVLGYIRKNPVQQLFLTLAYAIGTIAFPYSFLFFSHQTATFFAFAGFYLAFVYFRGAHEKSISPLRLYVIGLLLGLGFATEQPVGIIMLGVLIYLLYQLDKKSTILYAIAGIGTAMIIPLLYNYACFGSPFSLGYKYETLEDFKVNMAKGLMGITYPKLEAIWGITFSAYRGLFFLSPFLLFAFPGLYSMIKENRFSREGKLVLFIFAAFFYFNTSYYAWYGGWGIGPRHIIPLIPFLILPIYFLPPKWKYGIWITGILSIIHISFSSITEPQTPSDIPFPLLQFNIPRAQHGVFTRNILILLFDMRRPVAAILWTITVILIMIYLFVLAKKESRETTTTNI